MITGVLHLWGYGIRYALYFAFGWGALYWRRWRKQRGENIAQSWPSVQGIIIGGKVLAIPKTTRFHAILQYSYFIEEYRAGQYIHEFQKEVEADEFVRNLKDKRVQIRYNQSNPDKSVLEQSTIEQLVMLAPRFG